MKKKLFLGMMAATMMFATSCENELDLGTNAGETAQVTFSVGTPEIATRAFSDGLTATVLQYAVYDAEGNELTDLTKTDAEIHGSTTVNLQLTTGNTYSVIFWAAAEDAPYTVDFGTKTMTVDYSEAVSNEETRDAFYKYHTFTVTGAQTETIELKRPFAQLNIGTNDYAASESAGYTPAYSYVKVPVYNTLDLVEGKVSTVNGTGTSEDAVATEFKLATIPEGETFPVSGYEYLSMNYLLVAADKEVVDVVFGYSENNTTVEKTRTVGSVPVQRNYRTNIYGQLFTSNVDVNVVIEPDYDEPAHEADALHKAALNGGEVTLTEDVVLTAPLDVLGNLVINLNGKTITGAYSKSEGAIIKNNGTLKLVGGAVSSTGANGGSAIANYGKLVVEGTEIVGASIRENDGWPSYPINNYGSMTLKNATITGYQGAIACGDAGTTILENCTINKEYLNTSSHVFYIYHADAHVIVNGGTYTHNGMDGSLAYVISGSITVNDGEFSTSGGGYGMAPSKGGSVVIKGGSFASNPLSWGGEISISGGVFAQEPNTAWLAAGYKAIKNGDNYVVVANEIDAVADTEDDLTQAFTNGENVILSSDVDATASIKVNGNTLDGNGHTLSVPYEATSGWGQYALVMTNGGAIKNLAVEDAFRGIGASPLSGNITIDNVTIDNVTYAINGDGDGTNLVEVNNSTINGWISFSNIKQLSFKNCTLGKGNSYLAYLVVYGATTFSSCVFKDDFAMCADLRGKTGENVTFNNCIHGTTKVTADNFKTLFMAEGDETDFNKLKEFNVVVDGVKVVWD